MPTFDEMISKVERGHRPNNDFFAPLPFAERLKMQEKLGAPMEHFTLADVLKDPKFKDYRKEETVFASVLGTKIQDIIIHGVEYALGEGAVWRDALRVIPMDQAVVRVPKDAGSDYKNVLRGGSSAPSGGVKPSYTEIDVSDDYYLWRAPFFVDKTAIQDSSWNIVEDQMSLAGQAMGDCMNYYGMQGFDTASTQAYATDEYLTFLTARKVMKLAGYFPDRLILGPTGEANMCNLQKFIDANQLDRTGQNVRTGQIGKIFNIAVYGCSRVENLPTEGGKAIWGVLSQGPKAVLFGLRQEPTIEQVTDPFKWLEGGYVWSRFRVAINNTAAASQLLAA
jgi:hypothetical protein